MNPAIVKPSPMIIEWHNHVYPAEEAAAPMWQGRCPMSIENVLKKQ